LTSRGRNSDPWVLRNMAMVVLIPAAVLGIVLTATNASIGWWVLASVLLTVSVVGVVGVSLVRALRR
jgi:hypothetical protein